MKSAPEVPTSLVKYKKNVASYEVGIQYVDFNIMEVGIQDADFNTVKVDNRAVDFDPFWHSFSCLPFLKVDKWNADFNIVKVGILDANFNSNMHSVLF